MTRMRMMIVVGRKMTKDEIVVLLMALAFTVGVFVGATLDYIML